MPNTHTQNIDVALLALPNPSYGSVAGMKSQQSRNATIEDWNIIQTRLNNLELAFRKLGKEGFATAVEEDVSALGSLYDTLRADLDSAEIRILDTAATYTDTAVANERDLRVSGDNSLSGRIDAEVLRATAAEGTKVPKSTDTKSLYATDASGNTVMYPWSVDNDAPSTAGSSFVRRNEGRIPGVGDPVYDYDAVNKSFMERLRLYFNTSTYVVSLGYDDDENVRHTLGSVDLPLESMLLGASINSTTNVLTLTFRVGDTGSEATQTVTVDLTAMIGNALTNYVQKTDYATKTKAGIGKVDPDYGIEMRNGEMFAVNPAVLSEIKAGTSSRKPVACARLDQSVFYALAKAAGANLASSTEETTPDGTHPGVYPDNAKAAIAGLFGTDSVGTIHLDPDYWINNSQTVYVGTFTAEADMQLTPITNGDELRAQAAGLSVTPHVGSLTFYCTTVPTSEISFRYSIIH